MEEKREGMDLFADMKHQKTKYRKVNEIKSYQTCTTLSARIVHLPGTFWVVEKAGPDGEPTRE